MNREPINPLRLITKLVSLIEISCFSKRATPFCPIPARRLGLFLSLSLFPLSLRPLDPFNRGFLLRKGETPRGERYLLQPFLPSLSRVFLLSRDPREEERIYASRFEPRDPSFSSSPRPNRLVTSPSRARVFQRNARTDVYKGGRGEGSLSRSMTIESGSRRGNDAGRIVVRGNCRWVR